MKARNMDQHARQRLLIATIGLAGAAIAVMSPWLLAKWIMLFS